MKKNKEKNLTNESLSKKFLDRFQMTNFAIKVARDHVRKYEDGSLRDILEDVKEASKEITA